MGSTLPRARARIVWLRSARRSGATHPQPRVPACGHWSCMKPQHGRPGALPMSFQGSRNFIDFFSVTKGGSGGRQTSPSGAPFRKVPSHQETTPTWLPVIAQTISESQQRKQCHRHPPCPYLPQTKWTCSVQHDPFPFIFSLRTIPSNSRIWEELWRQLCAAGRLAVQDSASPWARACTGAARIRHEEFAQKLCRRCPAQLNVHKERVNPTIYSDFAAASLRRKRPQFSGCPR